MKIGRNEVCPCGSGKKYKRCCAGKKAAETAPTAKAKENITLGRVIELMQKFARQQRPMVQQVGVFLLYTDGAGDGWVLEVTESDCVRIAAGGNSVDVPLEEDGERIVIDWSHSFSFVDKKLQIRSYTDKKVEILDRAPVQQLFAARRKTLKKMSPELREQLHLNR